MANNRHCKLCEEPLPQLALHFSNQIAIEFGYCSWMCMNSDLGEEKAYAILGNRSKQNRQERSQEGQTGPKHR